MANPFREAAAAHSAAVDEVYGETLRLRPQGGGGDFATGGADPARPERTIQGTVTRRPLIVQRVGVGAASSENARLASATWTVSFSASLGLDVRAGDLVTRLDEPGTPTLRLAAPLSIPGRAIHPADEVKAP
jgi:hypothetical protein